MKKTMEELLKQFHTYLTAQGYAERTREEICRTVTLFEHYCEEYHIDPARIRIAQAEGYREYRCVVKHCAVSTVNKELSFLCVYFDYRVVSGMSLSNPFRAVEKMTQAHRLPRGILSIEETETLFAKVPLTTRDDCVFYTCIELLYATGMRIGELESLTRSNIHLDEGYIAFTDTKAKKERVVPLPEYSLAVLILYLKYTTKDSLFLRGEKRSLNRWLNDYLKRLSTRCDLPQVSCHSFRHTLATHLLKAGADIRQVQEYLGHRRIKTTEVYTRIFPEELLSVIEAYHPREQHS